MNPRTVINWAIIALIVGLALGWKLIYMNLRSDDPLPYGFVQYDGANLQAALAQGGPVIVNVYASWCPTCMAQHKALENILRDESFA
ncbi:MAG: hypothetical protein D6773_10075, partial [Alphaproteobacteria bacterium]